MRIVQTTPKQLVVKHFPVRIWVISSLVMIVGATLLVIPTSSPEEDLNAHVSAYAVITWGIIMILTSSRSIIWTFDKAANYVLIEYRKIVTIKRLKYTLTEIQTIQVETTLDGEGAEIFGIELVLEDNQSFHLCPSFSLSEFAARDGVRYISRFLESE